MAITVYLKLNTDEQNAVLNRYGYCLSKSVAADMTAEWFLKTHADLSGAELLREINEVLDNMGVPLLMTRLIER